MYFNKCFLPLPLPTPQLTLTRQGWEVLDIDWILHFLPLCWSDLIGLKLPHWEAGRGSDFRGPHCWDSNLPLIPWSSCSAITLQLKSPLMPPFSVGVYHKPRDGLLRSILTLSRRQLEISKWNLRSTISHPDICYIWWQTSGWLKNT